MDALLILGGLAMIIGGLLLLVMLAFGTSLLWGLGSLLPPVALIYLLRYWQRARGALLFSLMGLIPLVVGVTQLAAHDPERLSAILSLQWLEKPAEAPAELNIRLHGQLRGEPFNPREGELIDGVLRLREGGEFFARREVSIYLPDPVSGPVRLDVLPQDSGRLPEVEVAWLANDQVLPEARRLNRGFTLHLDLQPLPPNRMHGEFHLVLPGSLQTALSGQVELFTDHLRYRDGRVDTSHDSRETLAWVIRDYLQRRERTSNVQVHNLPPLSFSAGELSVQVAATLDDQVRDFPLRLLKSSSRGWWVEGDHYPPLPDAQPIAVQADAVRLPVAVPGSDRRQGFSLLRLQREPERYMGLRLRVQSATGSVAEGHFAGLNSAGQLQLERIMGGAGRVSYQVRPEDIQRIELLEP